MWRTISDVEKCSGRRDLIASCVGLGLGFFYIRNMINNGVYSCEKLKYVLKVFMKKHCQNCKILPNYSVCLILRTISISFCWTLRTNSICSC